jgi:tRNA (guanine37-N1)-methyltransferase
VHRYDVLTIHPDMLRGPLLTSILGRAVEAGTIAIGLHDVREHGLGRHRAVDDAPYGGGAGMVMRVDVVAAALEAIRTPESRVLLLSASGTRFDQAAARRLAAEPHLVLICGHYEGIDARIETLVDERISLGDFVLTGGEIAAAAVVDAVARLVPGVLHNPDSPLDESFASGLLEYPHYTRPREWRGLEVPEVLLSGNHARIAAWRRAQAEAITAERRPDLLRARVDDPDGSD